MFLFDGMQLIHYRILIKRVELSVSNILFRVLNGSQGLKKWCSGVIHGYTWHLVQNAVQKGEARQKASTNRSHMQFFCWYCKDKFSRWGAHPSNIIDFRDFSQLHVESFMLPEISNVWNRCSHVVRTENLHFVSDRLSQLQQNWVHLSKRTELTLTAR